MAEESSYVGFPGEYTSSFTSAPPPPVPIQTSGSRFELRPLSTGEILDRTFYLYRGNFWLFASISAFAAAGATLISIGQLLFQHLWNTGPKPVAPSAVQLATTGLLGVVTIVLYLLMHGVVHAATVSAVVDIYLGDTTSMPASFRATRGRWLRYVCIALWQFWSYLWVFMASFIPFAVLAGVLGALGLMNGGGSSAVAGGAVLGILMVVCFIAAFVLGAINYIRNSLGVPVEVMEKVKVRVAMKRSKFLAAGSKGRIFLLGLLMFALYIVAAGVQMPFAFAIAKAGPGKAVLLQVVALFLGFLVTTVVTPVGGIGLCLFYFDQRVRKEGFDIEFMLLRSGPPPIYEPVPVQAASLEPAPVELASQPLDETP